MLRYSLAAARTWKSGRAVGYLEDAVKLVLAAFLFASSVRVRLGNERHHRRGQRDHLRGQLDYSQCNVHWASPPLKWRARPARGSYDPPDRLGNMTGEIPQDKT